MNTKLQNPPSLLLGVNIDHVATLRQARYRDDPDSPNAEPSPLEAALAAERAGASGITTHLRADRRHIQEADLHALKGVITTKWNLEMGNTPEIVAIALEMRPEDVCLVPEERREVTTEGGLDCRGRFSELEPTIRALQGADIRVSLFIDPDPTQVAAAANLGAEFIELHTGAFANAWGAARNAEFTRLREAAIQAAALGLRVNAGHGLNYKNVTAMRDIPGLHELNIGHSIISRGLVVGMEVAVREMLGLISPGACGDREPCK